MYKVFVNDRPIILAEAKKISTNDLWRKFNPQELCSIVEKLILDGTEKFQLVSSNLPSDWSLFKEQFSIEKAAGGKVLNANDEILFIKRNGKWDLPKGKLEKGETIEDCAVREVEEECGIKGLIIKDELDTTYHIFKRNNKTILKITHWFLMETTFKGIPKPQLEEGIVEAVFKNKLEIEDALENTYANIRLLF